QRRIRAGDAAAHLDLRLAIERDGHRIGVHVARLDRAGPEAWRPARRSPCSGTRSSCTFGRERRQPFQWPLPTDPQTSNRPAGFDVEPGGNLFHLSCAAAGRPDPVRRTKERTEPAAPVTHPLKTNSSGGEATRALPGHGARPCSPEFGFAPRRGTARK